MRLSPSFSFAHLAAVLHPFVQSAGTGSGGPASTCSPGYRETARQGYRQVVLVSAQCGEGLLNESRAAVEQADSLVATVVKRIAEQFAAERADLHISGIAEGKFLIAARLTIVPFDLNSFRSDSFRHGFPSVGY
jgi:hypothetical protein